MSAFLLQCFLGAFGYGMVAIAMAWSLERLGLLRDGALAETLWRIALYAGLGIALVHAVKPLAAEWAAALDESKGANVAKRWRKDRARRFRVLRQRRPRPRRTCR